MGLGQTLLTIMALMLLGKMIISVNTTTLNAGMTKDLAEYRISGTSEGTSLLEQINSLAFDEAAVNFNVAPNAWNAFTDFTEFGLNKGESNLGDDDVPYNEASILDADDIDDYHDYIKTVTLENGVTYNLKAKVAYVNTSGIPVGATKTAAKMVTVEVTSDYLIDFSVNPPRNDTLRFKSIYGYWFFR